VGRNTADGVATRYGLGGPGIESRWRARFSAFVQTGPWVRPASYTTETGFLSQGQKGLRVALSTHPYLAPTPLPHPLLGLHEPVIGGRSGWYSVYYANNNPNALFHTVLVVVILDHLNTVHYYLRQPITLLRTNRGKLVQQRLWHTFTQPVRLLPHFLRRKPSVFRADVSNSTVFCCSPLVLPYRTTVQVCVQIEGRSVSSNVKNIRHETFTA
jgi:hypothetical protein